MYKYTLTLGVNSLSVDDEGTRAMNEGMESVNNITFPLSSVLAERRDTAIRTRSKLEPRSISRPGILDSDLNVLLKGSSNVVRLSLGGCSRVSDFLRSQRSYCQWELVLSEREDQLTKRSDLQLCLSNLAFEAWTDFQTAFLVVGL